MKNFWKIVWKPLVFGVVPALMIFFANSEFLWKYLRELDAIKDAADFSSIRTWLYVIGLILGGLITPILYGLQTITLDKEKEEHQKLITENRLDRLKMVQDFQGLHNRQFYTRVFIPKKKWHQKKHQEIISEDFPGITDSLPGKPIRFEINAATPEGIVGDAFNKREMVLVYNIVDHITYNLSAGTRSRIPKTEFCAAFPAFDKRNKNIVAIICLDSPNPVIFNDQVKEQEFEDRLIYYFQFIDETLFSD